MQKVALTEKEVVDKIPKFYREQERRKHLANMGRALSSIAETNKTPLIARVENINPADILGKKRPAKTYAPIYTNSSKPEVIGQNEAKKAVKAVKSGVPLAVPRVVLDGNSKKPIVRNEGIISARFGTAPGRTKRAGRRGGKRKRHKTRKRKRKRKRRKHFKGGFGEKPGVGIYVGRTVRIKTENSTDDTKTWDPCWKVIVKTPKMRGAIVKKGMEEKVVNDAKIKPQGPLSKIKLKCGGKRRKTRRRKKHKRRRKRKTYKK